MHSISSDDAADARRLLIAKSARALILAAVASTLGVAAAVLLAIAAAHAGPPRGCLPSTVRTALAQVDAACGITVVSTFRRGATIAGTGGSPSKHAACRAADFTARDYACAYRVLADWPGDMSIDAAKVKHIHIDNGHWGKAIRFRHGQSKRHRHRAARR
jgi:hypothetical protein